MLSVLYAAIDAQLVLMGAYVTTLLTSKRDVNRADPPPRIIMYWTGDTFGPPVMIGGKQKSIRTVYRVCQVVIHGETEDHVEGMRNQFVLALHKAVKKAGTPDSPNGGGGSYELTSATVNTKTSIAKNGVEYVATVKVPMAITDRRWTPGQAPVPSTYTGTQGDTYGTPPADTSVSATVGVHHDPPDDDTQAVEIDVTPE